jgi:UDP-N-acetylmuramoyl-tripeptide--D-alanyl-D-alanine ligase
VLSPSGKVHASAASFNNHWGVPLTLARMPADTDFGVFEIGMNHPGEITPLTRLVRPHIAIVTLIAAAHLGLFQGSRRDRAGQGGDFRRRRKGRACAAQSRRRQITTFCASSPERSPAWRTSTASARSDRAEDAAPEREISR